jgi:protein phosphatase
MSLIDRLFRGRKEKRVTGSERTGWSREAPGKLSFNVANLQMVGTRERQEDSFATVNASDVTEIARNGLFAIVADGMGGMQDGKNVSEAAVAELVRMFHGLDHDENIPDQLCDSIYSINDRLYEAFGGAGGTTAVMVMIYAEKLYWASVGDSAIFLMRNGGLTQLNKEHTYENQLYLEGIRSGAVDKEAVQSDVDKARLSGFMGMDGLEEIDYNRRPFGLRKNDVLLLCSDGISGMLSEDEILNALAFSPPEACARLNDAIVRKGNPRQDNYTGLIIACR